MEFIIWDFSLVFFKEIPADELLYYAEKLYKMD